MKSLCVFLLCISSVLLAQDTEITEAQEEATEPASLSEWGNLELDMDALFSEEENDADTAGVPSVVAKSRSPFSVQSIITAKFQVLENGDYQTPAFPSVNATLHFMYEDRNSRAGVNVNFDSDYVHGTIDPKVLWRQMVREAYFKLFFDTFNFEVGFLRPVWGQDDVERTVDILNILDRRSNHLGLDSQTNRLGQFMLRFHVFLSSWGLLELNYMPVFLGDIMPEQGSVWEFKRQADFYSAASTIHPAPTDSLAPEHGQAALRFTASVSRFDLGFIYSYGYLKQPTASIRKTDNETQLYHDRSHIFALEQNTTFGPVIWNNNVAFYLNKTEEEHLRFSSAINANLQVSNLYLILGVRGIYLMGDSDSNVVEGPNEYYNRAVIWLTLRDTYLLIITPEIGVGYDVFNHEIVTNAMVRVLLHINASFTLRSFFYVDALEPDSFPSRWKPWITEVFFSYRF